MLSVPIGAQPAPDCGTWLIPEFWQETGAADVERCLSAGADINAWIQVDVVPLHVAAAFGNAETVNALIDRGADPNPQIEDGKTPLYLIKNYSTLKGTNAYWQLNEGRFK